MRTIVSFVLLSILPAFECLNEGTVDLAFTDFQHKFGKKYESKEEEMKRNAIFQANLHHIEQVNAQNLSYTLGVNEYADLTHEEFVAQKVGILKMDARRDVKFDVEGRTSCISHARLSLFVSDNATELSAGVDWRDATGDVLTPIKNQGACGSCWAFSSTGTLESLYAIGTGQLRSFSEQQLVDCSRGYGTGGCAGGWMYQAFDYVRDKGIDLEFTYLYEGSDNTCQKCLEKRSDGIKAGIVTGWSQLQQTEQALMLKIQRSPVSVAMYASDHDFQFYSGGIYSGDCNYQIDHAVVMVGYGSVVGGDYFIGRNSWGTSWGMAGYFYLKRGVSGYGQCSILEYMYVPIMKFHDKLRTGTSGISPSKDQ
ncbi:cathepsin L, putative [Perkinsus marinus ATCC 50983]|uniref:Cathepsin L, putative n=1 Tax=Perkinsus marinus (strain ATCC 50983 / TXsc) TaxID=423536 RepID=C5LUC6_PERM5|nr:cathepsin L, putative [Perkinsus marinus ATCC 50983]EEQ99660.1 cathepsin L, putative [Perkinsus marinus ATCC 50983]|eukprot:XP_002766943.1 cathepsin L, putative [Perkinsus marinus ATCC 50983]